MTRNSARFFICETVTYAFELKNLLFHKIIVLVESFFSEFRGNLSGVMTHFCHDVYFQSSKS